MDLEVLCFYSLYVIVRQGDQGALPGAWELLNPVL